VPRLPTASKLADVGLNVDLPPDASSDDVLETLPTAGRIVAAGSTVDVTLVHRYPLDFGPSGAMAVGSPVVVCGDTGGAFAAVDVRASDAGSVTLSLVSGGTVVGQSDPAWMFAGQRTLLAVPIAPGLGNGTADVHIRQSTAGGGAQEASRTVSLSSDTASCS
jgi:hypothetical protein